MGLQTLTKIKARSISKNKFDKNWPIFILFLNHIVELKLKVKVQKPLNQKELYQKNHNF